MDSNRPSPRRDVVVLGGYLCLAIVLTYPLTAYLTTHQPGEGVDDPALTWALWWVKFSIFDLGASPLTSDYVFYPLGINLVAYTPTFLNGVISLPLQFAFDLVLAQNLIVYFSLVAGGYGTLLFVREVFARLGLDPHSRRSEIAAALAGAFYAFGAWHVNYVWGANFFLLSNEWIPFYALYLLRIEKQFWRNGALAGLFLVLIAWTEMTFALFAATLTALFLIYVLTAEATRRQGDKETRRVTLSPRHLVTLSHPIFLNLAVLVVIAAIGVSPLALNLLGDTLRYGYYLAAGVGRMQIFSAEPISFFVPSARHPLLGAWASGLTNANTHYAFIGYAALILAGLGFYARRASREARWWAALAVLFALIMLGPTLIVGGQNTNIPLPFAILRAIPFVNANRYPVRFNAMLMLSLTPLIALGAARLLELRRGALALGALTGLLAFEQLVFPIPLSDLRVPAIFQTLRDEPGDFAILEVPLGWRGSISMQGKQDDRAQFYQTVHHKRLLGGITSRVPSFKFQYFLEAPVINSLIALETGREIDETRLARDRAAAPEVLRFFDIRYVDMNRALTDPAVLQYVLDVFPLKEIYRDDTRVVYRVNALPASSRTINPADETARLYFDDRWGRPQFSPAGFHYRWATRADPTIWLPLEHADQTITFRLRAARTDQKISVRVNGQVVAALTPSGEWNDYAVRVPASVAHAGLNEFVFETETVPLRVTWQGDYAIGDTGFVSPVDISATGAGFNAGRFGEIFVAGKNVIESRAEQSGVEGKRGYHLVAINPQNGAVDRVASFDTFADPDASARLAQFIEQLPLNEIVAGVAIDDVSGKLQQSAIDALRSIGVEGDLRFQFRAGHAFIGVKGAQPGQALEQMDGRFPANVSVGKNVASDRVAFALAEIKVTSGE